MRMMIYTNSEIPWADIPASRRRGEFSVRLVDDTFNAQRVRVFWAKGAMGQRALWVEYLPEEARKLQLPRMASLQVIDLEEKHAIIVELTDCAMEENFDHLCLDLIAGLQTASPDALRHTVIRRLERWAIFLRPSRERLGMSEAKGLAAELLTFKRVFAPAIGYSKTLLAWQGPLGGRQDFAFGSMLFEVKSKGGASAPRVRISSPEQLEFSQEENLTLIVVELRDAHRTDENAITIHDLVSQIKDDIESPFDLEEFLTKLAKVGYFEEEHDDNRAWVVGQTEFYDVKEGFPRIDPKLLDPAVQEVEFSVNLNSCGEFELPRDDALRRLTQ